MGGEGALQCTELQVSSVSIQVCHGEASAVV